MLLSVDLMFLYCFVPQGANVQACGMPVEGTLYRLINNNYNCAGDVLNANLSPGGEIITYKNYAPPAGMYQEFYVIKINGAANRYGIMNFGTHLALDSSTNVILQQNPTCAISQHYSFESAPDCSFYYIYTIANTSNVLSNSGQNINCNYHGPIVVAPRTNTTDQQWKFEVANQASSLPGYPTCECGMPLEGILYRLVSNNFYCAAEVNNGLTTPGNTIITYINYPPPVQLNQEWYVKKISGTANSYLIISFNTHLTMDCSTNALKQEDPSCSINQQFAFESTVDCSFYIYTVKDTSKVLSNTGQASNCNNTGAISIVQRTNAIDQRWMFEVANQSPSFPDYPTCDCGIPVEGTLYRPVNKNFNCSMEVLHGTVNPGELIITYTKYPPPILANQEFYVKKINGTTNNYLIMSFNTHLALDFSSGVILQQNPSCSVNQQFAFESTLDCSLYIYTVMDTSKVLSNIGQISTCKYAGAINVVQRTNSTDQQWKFEVANQSPSLPAYPTCSEYTTISTGGTTLTTTEPTTTSYNQYYCSNGWLASTTGQCYMYFDNVASFFLWNAALTYCQAYNASLPIFRSMDEQVAYNNLMMSINVPDGPHQLGLYLDPGNGVEPPHWMWADNTVPTFFNWDSGSPSGGEDCSYMDGLSVNNVWNDYGCTWNLQPIAYCCQTNASIAVPPILKEMNISMDFLADPTSLTTTIQDIGPFLITSLNASMKEKLGQPYSDLVRICTYENKDCSDRANFQYLYNPNFGNCYTFNFEDKPKYFIKDVGPDYGLQILLSASQEDYSCASQNAGFRVAFHETNSTVYPESDGYYIPPGTVSTITLQQSTINRLGKPIYDCVDSDHNSGRVYSVEDCLRRCFQNYVIQQCHCADPRFPTTPNDSICHYNKKSCLDYINTCTFDEAMADCDCPPPCREIVYYPTITSVNIHSTDVYKKSFCSNAVDIYKCESSFHDNFAILYVYYRSLKTFEFSEGRTYDLMRLLSDFSGVTGLLLGVCVMTIPEVALLLFSLATSCCTKRK